MISADDVRKLALLGRLEVTDEEVVKFQADINSIVAYIDTVQKVEVPKTANTSVHLELENVMREDVHPHEGGQYSEELLGQVSRREGSLLKVKKILS